MTESGSEICLLMHSREDPVATGAGGQGGHGETRFLRAAAYQRPLGSTNSPQGQVGHPRAELLPCLNWKMATVHLRVTRASLKLSEPYRKLLQLLCIGCLSSSHVLYVCGAFDLDHPSFPSSVTNLPDRKPGTLVKGAVSGRQPACFSVFLLPLTWNPGLIIFLQPHFSYQ